MWIKLTDKLPPPIERVLLFVVDVNHSIEEIMTGYLTEEGIVHDVFWDRRVLASRRFYATHWRHLPNPPKD